MKSGNLQPNLREIKLQYIIVAFQTTLWYTSFATLKTENIVTVEYTVNIPCWKDFGYFSSIVSSFKIGLKKNLMVKVLHVSSYPPLTTSSPPPACVCVHGSTHICIQGRWLISFHSPTLTLLLRFQYVPCFWNKYLYMQ